MEEFQCPLWTIGACLGGRRELAAHHNLARTSFADENGAINERWLSAHARFHQVLLDGCPNHHLRQVATQLREAAEVYRCWARRPTEHSDRDTAAEHRIICERALERDVAGTVEALRNHIELTTELLLDGRTGDGTA